MKKQITVLLFLIFAAAGLAAETGYQGHKWYESIYDFPETNLVEFEETPSYGWMTCKAYNQKILGERTILFYGFHSEHGELTCAGYTISNEAAEIIKNDLGKKQKEYKVNAEDPKEIKTEAEAKWRDFYTFAGLEEIASYIENGYLTDEDIPEGDGVITIYNYNDDTNVYFFENFYDKRTIVIFIPYFKGY